MTDDEFARLFAEHYGAVLGYGLRRVDPDTARDVAAETFLVAWRRLDTTPDEPRTWLLAVARRVLANELRRRVRADKLTDRIAQAAATGGVPTVQPDHAEALAAASPVMAAMAKLSPRDQEVLQLIGWEQLDQVAAARVLGCTVTAVKVRLHRARRRLATLLQTTAPDTPSEPASVTFDLATEDL